MVRNATSSQLSRRIRGRRTTWSGPWRSRLTRRGWRSRRATTLSLCTSSGSNGATRSRSATSFSSPRPSPPSSGPCRGQTRWSTAWRRARLRLGCSVRTSLPRCTQRTRMWWRSRPTPMARAPFRPTWTGRSTASSSRRLGVVRRTRRLRTTRVSRTRWRGGTTSWWQVTTVKSSFTTRTAAWSARSTTQTTPSARSSRARRSTLRVRAWWSATSTASTRTRSTTAQRRGMTSASSPCRTSTRLRRSRGSTTAAGSRSVPSPAFWTSTTRASAARATRGSLSSHTCP
mmetsp:Transcript_20238/g.46951  ORF Transcript_20238/g.46951 Transcript_20238/m.46951 type:complete len:287 (-) Transcript_20238:2064-2924(-)